MKNNFYKFVSSALLIFSLSNSFAQVPTDQDCLGAIPICSYTFSTTNAYYGEGNYLNEHPPVSCTWSGEYNSVWFTFTVQQSGNLGFAITPVPLGGSDYDWFLYNLTNASCADIPTNSALMVSCNASQYGYTGMSATGVGNWNGPGFTNAFNALYPVTAGQTYVLNLSNWNATTGGFSINFSTSTAVIFDTIKPMIQSLQNVSCNQTSLTFTFSENVLCGTVSDADFTLTGPGGPYTLSGVNAPACTAGGNYDIQYSINVSPAITQSGTYDFNLVGTAGSVSDLCGNVANPATLQFVINGVQAQIDSFHNPICLGGNGEIFASGTNGTLPFQYSLNGGPQQATGIFTGLNSGNYVVTITDAGGCVDTVQVTLLPAAGGVTASILNFQNVLCNGACNGAIGADVTGGVAPYTYSWTNGGGTSQQAINLCPNTYQVTITDAFGCFDTISQVITEPPAGVFNLISEVDASCNGYSDGSAEVGFVGGTAPYAFDWAPTGGSNSLATNLPSGNYSVKVTDANACVYTFNVTVNEPVPLLLASFDDTSICKGTNATLNAQISGGTQPYSVNWDNGSFIGNPNIITPLSDTSYSAFVTDAHGCTTVPEDYSVLVVPFTTVDIGNDTTICEGDAFTRDAYFPGAQYLWNDGTMNSSYTFIRGGLYYVAVSNMCGAVFDSLLVGMDDCSSCVFVPNAFSPNGDGRNDFFLPVVTCTVTRYLFKVFNRWGQLVFETTSAEQGWNGKNIGIDAELGTYVYILSYQGINEKGLPVSGDYKGSVTLLR